MNTGGTNLRIRGLVRVMNRVRDQLRAGVQGSEARQLRALVRRSVKAVERICREHDTTPEKLPAPSRRAYEYLRALDLSHLPRPAGRDETPDEPLRISGILATCRRYHHRFQELATGHAQPFTAGGAEVQRLAVDLRTESDAIAALSEEAGSTAAALPIRSRRGYQWLTFLGDPQHLTQHLNALAVLIREGDRVRNGENSRGAVSGRQAQRHIHYELFATSVLYRTQARSRTLNVLINEGFIAAPDAVLRALVGACLSEKQNDDARSQVKRFAASPAFTDLQKAVYTTAASPPEAAQGRAHDLQAAFERVNATYFGGHAARPTLEWGRTRTYRKLGHYDDARDIVMVSPTLDDRAVPEYVIDFVIYHELLHKELGIAVRNGRRHAHTPEFRQQEHAFKRYREARAFLARLAKS